MTAKTKIPGSDRPAGLRLETGARGSTVLLLQGPVGPFFRTLEAELRGRGLSVERIAFTQGDRIFATSGAIRFTEGPLRWCDWLTRRLAGGDVVAIVMFGANRPYHRLARNAATDSDTPVLCLEEGYLRPGFVTAEWGGNNDSSPLRLPRIPAPSHPAGPLPASVRHAPLAMCLYGALHYGWTALWASAAERRMSHRRLSPVRELGCWLRNGLRAVVLRGLDRRRLARIAAAPGPRFVVALQVPGDANLGRAALGWTNARLIVAAIAAFARSAPATARLVIKVHPMDRGHFDLGPLVRGTARANAVADRVALIHTGPLGAALSGAAGLVTINSGAGLSAIHHGVPLLVVGDALYARPGLATCGRGRPDFDAFFARPRAGDPRAAAAFLARLRSAALVPGDFYSAAGRRIAADTIADRLSHTAVPAVRDPARLSA